MNRDPAVQHVFDRAFVRWIERGAYFDDDIMRSPDEIDALLAAIHASYAWQKLKVMMEWDCLKRAARRVRDAWLR